MTCVLGSKVVRKMFEVVENSQLHIFFIINSGYDFLEYCISSYKHHEGTQTKQPSSEIDIDVKKYKRVGCIVTDSIQIMKFSHKTLHNKCVTAGTKCSAADLVKFKDKKRIEPMSFN